MKPRILFGIIILFLLFASPAFAALYFEFAPDYYATSSLVVAPVSPVSEIFMPQNEYLGGFDFWFSNNSSPVTATFNLYSPAGQLMATKEAVVPAIATAEGGARFHISIPQIYVTSTSKYRLEVATTDQNLWIYSAPWIKVLGHNAPPLSQYQNGVAQINGQEQDFSFKFALYESQEVVPPVLSYVTPVVLSTIEAQIHFNANEPVDFKVDYGPLGQGYTQHTAYSGTYAFCAYGVEECRAVLAAQPGTSYQFMLSARDTWGNIATATGTFVTPTDAEPPPTPTPSESEEPTPTPSDLPPVDTTTPLISNVQIIALNPQSLQLSWQTNEPADSSLTIKKYPTLLPVGDISDATFELEHFIDTGTILERSASYRAYVYSTDPGGNKASTAFDFVTPRTTPLPSATPGTSATPTPTPTGSVSPTPSPGVLQIGDTDGGQQVSWNNSGNGNGYRIAVFDSSGRLISQYDLDKDADSATLDNLANGDNKVIVYEKVGEGYRKIAPPKTVRAKGSLFMRLLVSPWTYVGFGGAIFGAAGVAWFINRHKKPNAPDNRPLNT